MVRCYGCIKIIGNSTIQRAPTKANSAIRIRISSLSYWNYNNAAAVRFTSFSRFDKFQPLCVGDLTIKREPPPPPLLVCLSSIPRHSKCYPKVNSMNQVGEREIYSARQDFLCSFDLGRRRPLPKRIIDNARNFYN